MKIKNAELKAMNLKASLQSLMQIFSPAQAVPADSWQDVVESQGHGLCNDSVKLINTLVSQAEQDGEREAITNAVYNYGYDYIPSPDVKDDNMLEKTEMATVLKIIAKLPDVAHHVASHDLSTDDLRDSFVNGVQEAISRKHMMFLQS